MKWKNFPVKLWKALYAKRGKKALFGFVAYFIAKWTLTILFGAEILAFIRRIF